MIMMRKLLMTLMATAICTLVTTSCVKGPDDIPPTPPSPTPEPTPEEKYDAAFLNYVGGTISPNQDWGFNAGVIATRGMSLMSRKTLSFKITEHSVSRLSTPVYQKMLRSAIIIIVKIKSLLIGRR